MQALWMRQVPGVAMKWLCMIGQHDWEPYDWAHRVCDRCERREYLIYIALEGEATWMKVEE